MKVWIGRDVFEDLLEQARTLAPLETGGVLMGWRRGGDRIVMGTIGPGPKALHGRHMFLPDHAWQVARINETFAASGGNLDYLGDWHTHPESEAELSGLDRRTLQKLGRKVANSLMLIAAPVGGWHANAWIQPRGRLFQPAQAERCELAVFDAPSDWPRLISTPRA